MRKILYTSATLVILGSIAWAQSVGWPPPGGMMAALGVYNSTPPTLTNSQISTIQLSAAGRILVDAAGAGGGDATAANQTLQITQETAFNTALGLMADAACATDNGTCTTIALLKRGNQRLTTINTTLGTPFQAGASIGNTTFASTVADGANVVEGAIADAAATQSGTGTLSAKLRLLTTQFNTLNTTVALAANQTATQAPVAPATATATKSDLIGCQATSAAINPTTGQQAAVDCDLNNNLLVSSGGAPNLAISQVSVATSDTAVVAARALRRAVTIQQITGTQNVFCNQTTATAGNGVVLPAAVGASFTFNTTSAIRCIAITGAQTVAVAETF